MAKIKSLRQPNLTTGPSAEWAPAETGLSAVDLKTVANTNGSRLELGGLGHFMAVIEYIIAGTAPTVGTVKLNLECFSDAGLIVMPVIEIAQLTSTQAAGTYYAGVAWGPAGTPKGFGGGTVTITAANFDQLKCIPAIRLALNRTVAFDAAGTKTASVYFFGRP